MRELFQALLIDNGVQECLSRDFEYHNLDSAGYFLTRIEDIFQQNYLPNDEDIVRVRKISTSMDKITFTRKMKRSVSENLWVF